MVLDSALLLGIPRRRKRKEEDYRVCPLTHQGVNFC